jgi:hypothetical protein
MARLLITLAAAAVGLTQGLVVLLVLVGEVLDQMVLVQMPLQTQAVAVEVLAVR